MVSGFLVGLQLHPGGIKTVIPTRKREDSVVAFFGFKMNKSKKQPAPRLRWKKNEDDAKKAAMEYVKACLAKKAAA